MARAEGLRRTAASATGRSLHIAGQVGWNDEGVFEAKDLVGQFAQALDNVLAVLGAAQRQRRRTSPR